MATTATEANTLQAESYPCTTSYSSKNLLCTGITKVLQLIPTLRKGEVTLFYMLITLGILGHVAVANPCLFENRDKIGILVLSHGTLIPMGTGTRLLCSILRQIIHNFGLHSYHDKSFI